METEMRPCPHCGTPVELDRALLGATCGSARCEEARGDERRRERRARQAEIVRAIDERRAQIGERAGLDDAATLPIAIVPANRTRVVELPAHRKRRFREHLERVVAEAFALRDAGSLPPPAPIAERGPEPDTDEFRLLGAGCAACRGKCCKQGGDRAFVDVPTIARHLVAHPRASADEVVAAYLAPLGGRTYERACVYQGERGCRLPRQMRARICNEYFCDGLEDLRRALAEGAAPRAIAAAVHDETIVRLAVVAPSGMVELDPPGRTVGAT
jgi:predicted nucleic acid-binding Zn ribbon protein